MTNGTQKKGLSPIAWIAIGCGGLVVVGMVAVAGLVGFGIFKAKEVVSEFEGNPAKAAAEMMVRLNPEVELVESDDAAGTMTIRNTKTGEEVTLNFQDIAEGRFSVTTAEGEFSVSAEGEGEEGSLTFSGPEGEVRMGAGASLENVPDWVPLYPNATATQGTYNTTTATEVSGIVGAATDDDVATVIGYYEEKLVDEGYEITGQTSTTTPNGSFSSLISENTGEGRTLNIVAAEDGDGKVQVTINYNGKNP